MIVKPIFKPTLKKTQNERFWENPFSSKEIVLFESGFWENLRSTCNRKVGRWVFVSRGQQLKVGRWVWEGVEQTLASVGRNVGVASLAITTYFEGVCFELMSS